MKIFLTLKALAVGLLLATAAHAEIKQFVPSGPALIEGSHLNQMVDRLNGTTSGPVAATTLTASGNTTLSGTTNLVGSGVNKVSLSGAATTVGPVITVGGTSSDTNIGIVLAGKGTGAVHLGGSTVLNASVRVPTVASTVNQVEIGGAITTGIPYITVGGTSSDTNDAIAIYGKGTGTVLVGDSTTTLAGLQVAKTASAVNGILVTPGATGTGVTLSAATAGADTNAPINITPKGSSNVRIGGAIATCTGTTTATCQGQRFVVSVTGLTTAASTLSAAMTVTDANVVSSSAIVMCQTQGYGGTGVPVVVNVTPGTGSVAFNIQNVSTGAALNATVPVACFVFGT